MLRSRRLLLLSCQNGQTRAPLRFSLPTRPPRTTRGIDRRGTGLPKKKMEEKNPAKITLYNTSARADLSPGGLIFNRLFLAISATSLGLNPSHPAPNHNIHLPPQGHGAAAAPRQGASSPCEGVQDNNRVLCR